MRGGKRARHFLHTVDHWCTEDFLGETLKVVAAFLVAVVFFFIFSTAIPESKYVQNSLTSLENSQKTVMEFTGATMATSVAISALPDDFATPLANALADMNKYFVFLMIAIFVERLILLQGIRLSCMYVIPLACVMYGFSHLIHKGGLRQFALKILAFGLAIIMVVPISTYFAETVGSEYMEYVNETIEEANENAGIVNEAMGEEAETATIFEKLSDAFHTAIEGINDLLGQFKNIIKKCVTSIAILLIVSFLMPMGVFFLLGWLFKELFSLHVPMPAVHNHVHNHNVAAKGE